MAAPGANDTPKKRAALLATIALAKSVDKVRSPTGAICFVRQPYVRVPSFSAIVATSTPELLVEFLW
jgi:hypothetical protein